MLTESFKNVIQQTIKENIQEGMANCQLASSSMITTSPPSCSSSSSSILSISAIPPSPSIANITVAMTESEMNTETTNEVKAYAKGRPTHSWAGRVHLIAVPYHMQGISASLLYILFVAHMLHIFSAVIFCFLMCPQR